MIWDILYIENLVMHLSSLHFRLQKNIWFVEIWKTNVINYTYLIVKMVQIYQYMNM